MKPAHTLPPGLDLIYRDESLIVVNKPAGLLAVPGRGADKQDCLASRVQAEFPDALVVHRLDMATSGLLLFARGAEVQRRLSHLFRERLVSKHYVAVVSGRLEQPNIQSATPPVFSQSERGRSLLLPSRPCEQLCCRSRRGCPLRVPGEGWDGGWGEIDLPLMRDWPNRPRQKVDFASGKPSLTRYRLLAHDASTDTSRVELEPVTGRTHQLRVHLAASGHPILGDALYGEEGRAERLLLHASALSFLHPLNAELLSFASEPPF